MDVLVLIDKLDDSVHNAKSVPLTDQVRVDKEEIYDILDQMRATIPEEIKQARWIVKERQEMLAEAKKEAERIIKDARERQERLVGEEEVTKQAERAAEDIVEDARAREREIRLGAEDYADEILNTLEVNLSKFIAAVQRGRERLQGKDEPPKSVERKALTAIGRSGRVSAMNAQEAKQQAAGRTDAAGHGHDPPRTPGQGRALAGGAAPLGADARPAAYTAAAVRFPDRAAIVDDRGTLTFAEVHRRTNALARALRAAGIGEGDDVAIMCRNHRGFIEATVACSKLGAGALYLNTAFAGPQITDVLAREDPAAVIYDEEFTELVAEGAAARKRFVAWCEPGVELRRPHARAS